MGSPNTDTSLNVDIQVALKCGVWLWDHTLRVNSSDKMFPCKDRVHLCTQLLSRPVGRGECIHTAEGSLRISINFTSPKLCSQIKRFFFNNL